MITVVFGGKNKAIINYGFGSANRNTSINANNEMFIGTQSFSK